ncbi:DegT/DnrJ/EryC1/StrS family aminotransferase [uncultured Sphaerochaeta sp.]|uniref:DegT/DnrJ/EryC1/StrS family aminotransferase n=1 Tax=uncultured Sphaerochaeta sp. TaxID=886478 RepID=UPI002A0A638C|nr:DegT/DnrJ/EryC1/StrS family aminotransferase [uncultured Sphaerochaeta sp.]
MEFRDLKKQYQVLKADMDKAVIEVMTECNFINGRQVRELEEQLAAYVGVKHCITCGNGTDALSMMLMAWGIGQGDAVFVPDFTFFASGEVVSFEGATPVFVDVDPDTYNMDPASLEQAILAVEAEGKLKAKVVIPVDLFGLPADYDRINEIAHRHGMKVLEDGAQGFGGLYKGRKACSLGDAATTSFFPAKPLGCYGDGGVIFTNSDQEAEYLRSIAVHGKGSYKYDNVRIGWNSRLDTIQAAVLLVKFKAFQAYELEAVNKVASWYTNALGDAVKTPVVPEGCYSSWAQYTIQLGDENQRTEIQGKLKEQGIPTMVYYPKPMHEQTAFDGLKQYVQCPVTERLCKTVVSLPLDGYKTYESCVTVSTVIKSFALMV